MTYSLTKISKELGVSKSTVSLVLNGKAREARISREIEEKILKFCREINYVPNIHAQKINRKFISNIGFLVNRTIKVDNDNPFTDYNISSILGGIVLEAENHGCKVSVQLYNDDMDEKLVFDWLRSSEIDALIYYGISMPDSWKKVFFEEHRAIAGIGIMPDDYISSVNIDNFSVSHDLTKYLIDKGRKSFLYLSGVDESFVSAERKNGFLSACYENDITVLPENIVSAKFSEDNAKNAVLSHKLSGIDAIICANDDMALGALSALKERGVSVPEDISVTGGDNIIIGKYCTPSLTTFDNKQYELGRNAVSCVIDMFETKKAAAVVVPTQLIIRTSA